MINRNKPVIIDTLTKSGPLVIQVHLRGVITSNKLSTSEPLTTSFMQADQQLSGRQLSMHVFGRLVLWSHIPSSLQTD